MKKQEIYIALKSFEKNLEFAQSNLFYPNMPTSRRREFMDLHDKLFRKKTVITVQCNKCVLPYLKLVADWYFKQDFTESKEQEVPE